MNVMRRHSVFMSLVAFCLNAQPGITMSFKDKGLGVGNSGSGLGDRLMIYIKAKRASYQLGIPLLLNWTFPQYQDFKFVKKEQKLRDDLVDINTVKKLPNNIFQERLSDNTLYVIGQRFTFEPWQDTFPLPFDELYDFCVQNKTFLKILRRNIQLGKKIKKLDLPVDKVTIALHIRYGSQDLFIEEQVKRPLKFPPLTYYIDQIKLLVQKFSGRKIYIYVFTDYHAPEQLVSTFKKVLNNQRIEFAYRKKANENCLYADLYSMMEFDCLIRPSSSFSRIAQLLGNHKVIIYPLHSVKEERGARIDKVIVLERSKRGLRFQEVEI